MNKKLSRLKSDNLVGWHATVGAANPQVLRVLNIHKLLEVVSFLSDHPLGPLLVVFQNGLKTLLHSNLKYYNVPYIMGVSSIEFVFLLLQVRVAWDVAVVECHPLSLHLLPLQLLPLPPLIFKSDPLGLRLCYLLGSDRLFFAWYYFPLEFAFFGRFLVNEIYHSIHCAHVLSFEFLRVPGGE